MRSHVRRECLFCQKCHARWEAGLSTADRGEMDGRRRLPVRGPKASPTVRASVPLMERRYGHGHETGRGREVNGWPPPGLRHNPVNTGNLCRLLSARNAAPMRRLEPVGPAPERDRSSVLRAALHTDKYSRRFAAPMPELYQSVVPARVCRRNGTPKKSGAAGAADNAHDCAIIQVPSLRCGMRRKRASCIAAS